MDDYTKDDVSQLIKRIGAFLSARMSEILDTQVLISFSFLQVSCYLSFPFSQAWSYCLYDFYRNLWWKCEIRIGVFPMVPWWWEFEVCEDNRNWKGWFRLCTLIKSNISSNIFYAPIPINMWFHGVMLTVRTMIKQLLVLQSQHHVHL